MGRPGLGNRQALLAAHPAMGSCVVETLPGLPLDSNLRTFSAAWRTPSNRIPDEAWIPGAVKLDPRGPAQLPPNPRPLGKHGSRPVWDATKRLPGLFQAASTKDGILLVESTPRPGVRRILPEESTCFREEFEEPGRSTPRSRRPWQ